MEMTILTGDDEQAVLTKKAELLKISEGNYEKIDCAEDPSALLDAVRSLGLFSPRRFVWAVNFEALSEADLQALISSAPSSSALIVARSGVLSPKARSLLKGVAEILNLTQPKGKYVAMRVAEMIRDSGLKLNPEARRILTERTGHDLDRLASVLTQCKMASMMTPSSSQIEVLVGTSVAPGVPWALSDAIEAGDHSAALKANVGIAPLAATAYLSNRFIQAGKVAEAGDDDSLREEVFKSIQRFQIQKISKVSADLGVTGTRKAIRLLSEFDLRFKTSPSPDGEFDLLLLKLTDLFKKL